jgi:hypothetical protein
MRRKMTVMMGPAEREQAAVAGRLLAARRRQIERPCEECGRPIVGTSRRRFCADTCAARARREAAIRW